MTSDQRQPEPLHVVQRDSMWHDTELRPTTAAKMSAESDEFRLTAAEALASGRKIAAASNLHEAARLAITAVAATKGPVPRRRYPQGGDRLRTRRRRDQSRRLVHSRGPSRHTQPQQLCRGHDRTATGSLRAAARLPGSYSILLSANAAPVSPATASTVSRCCD
jgi:hypothetical protein